MTNWLSRLLFDLENTPDSAAVIVKTFHQRDPLGPHYREHLGTSGELRGALSGADIPDELRNVKVTVSVLNIRSGAGTSFPKVGALTLNRIVEINVSKSTSEWLRLAPEQPERWIAAQYTVAA